MINLPIPRLDKNPEVRNCLLKYSRLKEGEIWNDPLGKHRIGCLDAASQTDIERLMDEKKAVLAIHDPPYNLVAFEERELYDFIQWCKK